MIIDTQLNDGLPICIREVDAGDEARLREGIAKLSSRSRYLRFFSGMREPPQHVLDALLDVDGYRHIAWGAIAVREPGQPALGVVHAFRDEDDPSVAEFSVAVIDAHHGKGLARLLTAVLLLDCRSEGLETLDCHVLPDNEAALALARSLGGRQAGQERGVVHFEIEILAAIEALKAETDVRGLAAVFRAWDERSD
ncbi:GNAT family N-acetyltransferase [Erythrobacter sp. GH1-10]|uniref:N-acetyltransferase family protein n=1 Tax=Erythrobacter sp. GH1-10 TaxID=3349334 RepID=UPI0038783E90